MAQATMQRETATRASAGLRWSAVLVAGLAAGAVFLVLELVTGVILRTGTLLGPAHLTLGAVLGLDRLPAGGPGAAMVFVVLVFHFMLSLLTTAVLSKIVHAWRAEIAVAVGVLYGALLYSINFHVFALVLPGITAGSDVVMFVDYMLYGGTAAWVYMRLTHRRVVPA